MLWRALYCLSSILSYVQLETERHLASHVHLSALCPASAFGVLYAAVWQRGHIFSAIFTCFSTPLQS